MNKKKILVVEDDPELVKAVKIRLEQSDYDVITAYDGMAGLDEARRENPDLIILDLMLPKMDGYKLCSLLKRDKKYAKIPIIIFTARAQELDKQISEEVGADLYITKPFQHEIVLAKIKELLTG